MTKNMPYLTPKIKRLALATMMGLSTITASSQQQNSNASPNSITNSEKTSWWEKARFGMFIHWGVYAVPAGIYEGKEVKGIGEWIMLRGKIPVDTYKSYAKQFNPTAYNPEQWVLMAKATGMKYIVVTTKHHDGFALFDTKASDWNVVQASPYGKDLIKPLADACRKHGMKLGFYYSQANDWVNKGGAVTGGQWDEAQKGSMDEYIDKVAVPQVREILTNYGDVAELWWDVPTGMNKERAEKFLPLLKLQPNMLTNDRLGGGQKGDLSTPEQYIPATGLKGLWEGCMTVNDTWGYKVNDQNWKSGKTLIRNLIEIASKGGNYLLNIGPDADGRIPQPIVDRFAEIGQWMKVNGEAIYGTSSSPFRILPWGKVTTKFDSNTGNTTLYLHVFEWPANGKLNVSRLNNSVLSASLLANNKTLKTKKQNDNVIIDVPAQAPDKNATVIKLQIAGKPNVTPFYQKSEADGSFVLTPTLGDVNSTGRHSIHVEKNKEGMYLGNWTDAEGSVSWPILIAQSGTYEVEILASATATSAVILSSGTESIQKEITATGGNDKFVKVNMGKIKLDQKGIATILLKAVAKNWKPVNVREIKLTPIK